jgi:hypothetical protein
MTTLLVCSLLLNGVFVVCLLIGKEWYEDLNDTCDTLIEHLDEVRGRERHLKEHLQHTPPVPSEEPNAFNS